MFDTSLNHFKSVATHDFFVLPADQNYFLARFTRIYGFAGEFWWQSLQAIEKYLKAGLLLNGVSVKKSKGHEIFALWEEHSSIFGELAVTSFVKPALLHDDFWRPQTVGDFIHDVETQGQPDSRYGLVSHREQMDDLFKLDQLVFELRRRTIGLDWIVGRDWPENELEEYKDRTYRDVILEKPDYQVRPIIPPKATLNVGGDDITDLFHSWNFAFSRGPEDLSRKPTANLIPMLSTTNAHPFQLIEALNLQKMIGPPVNERIQWLLDSIKLPRSMVAELKRRLKDEHA